MSLIIDPLSIHRIKDCHPATHTKMNTWLVNCSTRNVGVRIVQGIRTFGYQDELYAQGRTKEGLIVTDAEGGESWHNYGLAFDFALLHKDRSVTWDMLEDLDHDGISDWMEAVEAAKELGFEWGGDWTGEKKDFPHFDMKFGLTIKQARDRLEKGFTDKDGFIYICKR